MKKNELLLLVAISASTSVNALQNVDISFAGSYLYWGVQEDQLCFAIDNFDSSGTFPDLIPHLVSHDPTWNSGFRLATSISSPCLTLGTSFEWTHLQTQSKAYATSFSPDITGIAITTASASVSGNGGPFLFADTGFSRWKTNINELALDFDYRGCCGQSTILRPYLGVFAASIYQNQNITYDGVISGGYPIGAFAIKRNNNFIGIGPRFGLSFDWKLFCNLSLFSDFNTAFLVGQFDVKNQYLTSEDIGYFIALNAKTWQMRPMINGSIGFAWEENFLNCMNVTLSIAYECQYWWQQWHSTSNYLGEVATGDGRWGDLSINGLVASLGVTF